MEITINETEIQRQLTIIDMKTIGVIGFILALIGLFIALYCQVEILPNYSTLNVKVELTEMEKIMWRSYSNQKFLFGNIALFIGALATVMGLISGVKKQKMGWISLVLGLITFVLGAIQATHLFA